MPINCKLSLMAALAVTGATAADWISPPYEDLYTKPLPIPPVKEPKMTVTNPVTNNPIDYYEVNILPFQHQVYPNAGPADLIGYDGISPGPTFLMTKGREAVVRFVNNGTNPAAIHLHGSFSRAPWDGWAEDTAEPNEYKDYYYPNSQSARTLWYHDHGMHVTAENSYFGQAGAYILQDPNDDALNLPRTYGVDDIPLILTCKQYLADGTLFNPVDAVGFWFGDIIHVNGEPWPFMDVEPKKYRLRFLDASVSRSFHLYFEEETGIRLPFQVIGSDAGLLESPVDTEDLYISMAERYEVIFDFTDLAGQNITLRNTVATGADIDYPHTDKVMQFNVGSSASSDAGATSVPSSLREITYPEPGTEVSYHFLFARTAGQWTINGVVFSDVNNRVLAKPARGTVQIWELQNASNAWTHPIHIHLVDFRVIARSGTRGIAKYESQGLKDVVWLGLRETVTVEAHFAPWDGVYMFHCHNLIHEDDDMMAAFNATVLEDLGYNETRFIDPMEDRWRAKPAVADDFTEEAITANIQFMASLEPYNNVDTVYEELDAYWSTRGGLNQVKARRLA